MGDERMSEPMKDMSLAPLAAIRCGNTGCPRYDETYATHCDVRGPHGGAIDQCSDYRPADHIPDATKTVKCYNADCDYYDTRHSTQCCAESTSPVCICAGYRTAADQAAETDTEHPAITELAKLRRALELIGVTVPDIDIDDTMYEYSPRGSFDEGKWPEVFSFSGGWMNNSVAADTTAYLTRRRRRVRRAPTDQDAIEQPRRECWVRAAPTVEWKPSQLLAVDTTHGVISPYYVRFDDGAVFYAHYCEIEVEA